MQEKTVKILMAAIEKQLGENLLSYKDTVAARKAMKDGSLEIEGYEEAMKYGTAFGIWPEIEEGLRKLPEPTGPELQNLIKNVPEIQYSVRRLLPQIRKLIPHPRGGAPTKLDAKQKTRAVQLVGTLMGRGDTYSEALQNVAIRFGVSAKTIQRAWQAAHPRKRKRN